MSFNIWERWPWTSFQNLNLDWLMNAVEEATTKAEEASESVGQFDDRITANTEAIDQLSTNMETISSPARVLVSAELQARYRGNLVTGSQLLAMLRTHGDLPFVEYNGEVYMLDTPDSSGDLRFSMAHTTLLGDVTLRHITIFAQSSDVAYSVTNVGGGGSGSSDVMVVTITGSGSSYTMDSTYAAITSQLDAGKAVIVRVQSTGSMGAYAVSGMIVKETRTVEGQTMGVLCIIDPNIIHPAGAFDMWAWYIYEDNTVGHGIIHENIATWSAVSAWVNDGDTNALLNTAQTLTDTQKTIVQNNIGIHDKVVVPASSNTIPSIRPGVFYDILGQRGSIELTLSSPDYPNDANEYHARFRTAAAPSETTIILPAAVHVPVGFGIRQAGSTDIAFILSPSTIYEISILDDYLSFQVWEG